MEEYKIELMSMKKVLRDGLITGENKTSETINLDEVKRDIDKTSKIRHKLLEEFERDSSIAIKNLNLDYLKNVHFPLIINSKEIVKDGLIKVKLFSSKHVFSNCLFNEFGIIESEINSEEVFREADSIMPYIKGLFRVINEDSFLDNSFYDELIVLLYNEYFKKLIISGNGIKFDFNEFKNLNAIEKLELERLYYKNIKKILSNIRVSKVLELERFKTDKSLKKVLDIYRG